MADITKCNEAEHCKNAEICYRAYAPDTKSWQSYTNFKSECKCNEENNYPYLWVRGKNNDNKD